MLRLAKKKKFTFDALKGVARIFRGNAVYLIRHIRSLLILVLTLSLLFRIECFTSIVI